MFCFIVMVGNEGMHFIARTLAFVQKAMRCRCAIVWGHPQWEEATVGGVRMRTARQTEAGATPSSANVSLR